MSDAVFDPDAVRRALQHISTSPIVQVIKGNDRPWSESTMEIARHADDTYTVLSEDIKWERRK